MRTLIVGLLASSAALADVTTTTFVCVDEKGRKAIQDSPCPGSHASRAVPTVQHQQTFAEAIGRMQDRSDYQTHKIRCDALRRSTSAADRRQALEICKGY